MSEPVMSLDEAKTEVAKKTAPRVSEDSIKGRIQQIDYRSLGTTTICVITMINQFKVIGHSTPASPTNFDRLIGERYAYENAFRQIWQLEGYLLCEQLHQAKNPDPAG